MVAEVARVEPAPKVKVPVPVEIVLPFTVDGVIAPRVKVIAGVVVDVATEPDTPLAVVIISPSAFPLIVTVPLPISAVHHVIVMNPV